MTILWILTALFVKHFICDFLYQPPYQWKNKGTYGHWGGLVHTGQHVVATIAILAIAGISLPIITMIAVAEFIVHYHTDWAKMNVNRHYGWGATTHNEFWILTGLDQLVHALTYMGMAFYLTDVYT
jgi:hypothetical protein